MTKKTLKIDKTDVCGESVQTTVLDCGLPVMVVPKKDYRRTYGLIGINYGSIDNDFSTSILPGRVQVPDGIAHFLEHKMFEKEDGDVMEKFSQMGVSSNAMTSFNHTGYLFETTGDPEAPLELLIDFVTRPYFREALVEKEKGIIGEEIKMYLDDPGWRGFMGVLEDLYPGHPLSIDIAGSLESIAEITADDLQLCYDAFYTPTNMHLAVAGDMDLRRVARIAERVIRKNKRDERVTTERHQKPVRKKPKARRRKVIAPVSNQKLYLGYRIDRQDLKGVDPISVEIALDTFLSAVLGRSGPLYQELFHRGLLDDSFGFSTYSEQEYAFVIFSGDSPDAAKLDRELARGLKHYLEIGVPAAELRRQRRKAYGDFVGSFDSVSSLCGNLVECFVKGSEFSEYGDKVRGMRDDHLLDIARRTLRSDRANAHCLIPGAARA